MLSKCIEKQKTAHPIAIGETVTIISVEANTAFIDGLAIIKGPALGPHRYKVRFVGDPRVRVRLVHPAYQRDPVGAVAWVNALLRSSREPETEKFFPSDDQFGEGNDEPQ